MNIMRKINIH